MFLIAEYKGVAFRVHVGIPGRTCLRRGRRPYLLDGVRYDLRRVAQLLDLRGLPLFLVLNWFGGVLRAY